MSPPPTFSASATLTLGNLLACHHSLVYKTLYSGKKWVPGMTLGSLICLHRAASRGRCAELTMLDK